LLDISHLEAQVCGDRELAQELLRLYARSLSELAPAIRGEAGRVRREATHKLKGASLAVGAFRLALLCEELETQASAIPAVEASDRGDSRHGRATSEIARALEATRRRVGELLRSGCG
jgi:HPt (histidine-containing phosphotransfer) domain-containing protein